MRAKLCATLTSLACSTIALAQGGGAGTVSSATPAGHAPVLAPVLQKTAPARPGPGAVSPLTLTVTMPDIRGMDRYAGSSALASAGLKPQVVLRQSPDPAVRHWVVTDQSPPPGTLMRRGATASFVYYEWAPRFAGDAHFTDADILEHLGFDLDTGAPARSLQGADLVLLHQAYPVDPGAPAAVRNHPKLYVAFAPSDGARLAAADSIEYAIETIHDRCAQLFLAGTSQSSIVVDSDIGARSPHYKACVLTAQKRIAYVTYEPSTYLNGAIVAYNVKYIAFDPDHASLGTRAAAPGMTLSGPAAPLPAASAAAVQVATVIVPNLIGQHFVTAGEVLEEAGLRANAAPLRNKSATVSHDVITAQSSPPGAALPKGSTITITYNAWAPLLEGDAMLTELDIARRRGFDLDAGRYVDASVSDFTIAHSPRAGQNPALPVGDPPVLGVMDNVVLQPPAAAPASVLFAGRGPNYGEPIPDPDRVRSDCGQIEVLLHQKPLVIYGESSNGAVCVRTSEGRIGFLYTRKPAMVNGVVAYGFHFMVFDELDPGRARRTAAPVQRSVAPPPATLGAP